MARELGIQPNFDFVEKVDIPVESMKEQTERDGVFESWVHGITRGYVQLINGRGMVIFLSRNLIQKNGKLWPLPKGTKVICEIGHRPNQKWPRVTNILSVVYPESC